MTDGDKTLQHISSLSSERATMLQFHPDTVNRVRASYNLAGPRCMDEAVDILQQWIKEQAHFNKKDFPRKYIEYTIILSKGSLERSKKRFDSLCTYRTMLPHFFGDYDVRVDFEEFDGVVSQALLPRLTRDHSRVLLIRNRGHEFRSDAVLQYSRLIFMYVEYVKLHDYADGFIIILDALDTNLTDLIAKFNLVHLHQAINVIVEGYGARIKGIHFLSRSKTINIIVNIVKQFLSDKLKSRIHVHGSMQALQDHVQRDILPLEYGGDERSIDVIHEEWLEIIGSAEHRSFLREMCSARTDEAHRHAHVFNAEYMGMPGSFRALAVD